MRKPALQLQICLFFTVGFAIIFFQNCRKETDIPVPVIRTVAVSKITQTSASCGGVILTDGGSKVISSGVCWSAGTNPGITDMKTVDGTGMGTYFSDISGLIPNAKYFIRSYASNSSGTGYGEVIEFVTLAAQVPVLKTIPLSNITQTSATCGGEITYDGGLAVTLRGVCYSTSPNPTLSNSFTTNGTGMGQFLSNITGISKGTTYYIRAYASNSFGTTYGNELIFSTIVVPELITLPFRDLQGISAFAGGSVINNGGDKNLIVGLCWSTNPNPDLSNSDFNRSFNSPMTGLIPNTDYYARAYATNKTGTAYGNQIFFNSGYIMGYRLGGGMVFYNDGNSHGKVCAPVDQSKGAPWGCYGIVTKAFSTAIDSGYTNTNAIIAECSAVGFGARLCYDLVMKKYSDWYMPSSEELNLLYLNLHKNKLGGFSNYYYWSSSEFGDIDAWLLDFSSGNIYYYLKSQNFCVRAIRNF